MQNLDESTFTGGRFYDFRKIPFDGLNKRTIYQFWPAFESEMKRKGLSPVMDLRFNPLPTEPTASFRKVAHDDEAMQVLVTAYDAALSGHLLNGGVAPDIDSLKIAPDDLAATPSDRKAIKSYHDEMERQATSANQALGLFISFTTKSVQNDLAHILDDTVTHPRHKIFQLRDFFTRQTAPNVSIGEKIKMEIGDLPQARNYTDILSVANSIQPSLPWLILWLLLLSLKWYPNCSPKFKTKNFRCFDTRSLNGKSYVSQHLLFLLLLHHHHHPVSLRPLALCHRALHPPHFQLEVAGFVVAVLFASRTTLSVFSSNQLLLVHSPSLFSSDLSLT